MASRFWKYFHDKLNWMPIHRPGPLAAIARGLAHEMDDSRADILWLREQWHPARCERESVLGYGLSRGLQRHPRETDEQWRNRVVHAYAWHMLGGKVEGLPKILKFYGFDVPQIINMRQFLPSRWAEFQLVLNTPATQEQQEQLLADLDMLIWLVNEYKPARSLMFRICTDTYDIHPLVWSVGSWSECFWSDFSGVPYPDPDKFQKGDVIVSFGMAHRVQSERIDFCRQAFLWFSEHQVFRFPLFRRPAWSASMWGQKYETRKPFAVSALLSVHGCEIVARSTKWPEEMWPQRPWGVDSRWDRRLADWSMFVSGVCKSQAVWSDGIACEKNLWPDAPWPRKTWAEGPGRVYERQKISTWSGLNSNWSTPVVLVRQAVPVWAEGKWSEDDLKPRYMIIAEQFLEKYLASIRQLAPAFDGQKCLARHDALFMVVGSYPILTWEQADCKSRIDWQRHVWSEDRWPGAAKEYNFTGWPDAPWGRESGSLEPVINAILRFYGSQTLCGKIQPPKIRVQAAHWQELAQKGLQIAPERPKAAIEADRPGHACNATQAATWADRSLWPDEPWDAPIRFYREQAPIRNAQEQCAVFKGEANESQARIRIGASFSGVVEHDAMPGMSSHQESIACICGDDVILPVWDGSGSWPDKPWDIPVSFCRKQQPVRSGQKQCAVFQGEAGESHARIKMDASFSGVVGHGAMPVMSCQQAGISCFCGDEAILPVWDGSGAWPDRAWDKILGYGRKQAPMGFMITREIKEEAA